VAKAYDLSSVPSDDELKRALLRFLSLGGTNVLTVVGVRHKVTVDPHDSGDDVEPSQEQTNPVSCHRFHVIPLSRRLEGLLLRGGLSGHPSRASPDRPGARGGERPGLRNDTHRTPECFSRVTMRESLKEG
jgi:hypothetical protein